MLGYARHVVHDVTKFIKYSVKHRSDWYNKRLKEILPVEVF